MVLVKDKLIYCARCIGRYAFRPCQSVFWLAGWLLCVVAMVTDSSASSSSWCVRVSYSELYVTLCQTLSSQQTTLLLYMLLHKVDAVRAFILSRANIDHLVCTTHRHTHRHAVTWSLVRYIVSRLLVSWHGLKWMCQTSMSVGLTYIHSRKSARGLHTTEL